MDEDSPVFCLLSLCLAIGEDLAHEGRASSVRWRLLLLSPCLFSPSVGSVASPVFSSVLPTGNTGGARVLKSLNTTPPWRLPSGASGG